MKIFAKTLTFALLVSTSAMAHVEPGMYLGATAAGQPCSMVAKKTYFENNVKHPLNERIEIKIQKQKYIVQHPPIISVVDQTAAFNHDMFQGVVPNATGATALVVTMSHAEGSEGPTEFHLISHEYKTDKRSMVSCLNIKLTK